ncbi:MAG: (2Fe-2S)-binding protein [Proteobacteria bacterium]|nr:(2Fe-2S)-binding protein [Pseudomonadota bacterium]MBU1640185.1 (2Fe-2S)-binding protein [Pseudomonadota bacterium]
MIKLNINNREYNVEAAADEPLLWVIRDRLELTGTKFGCGIGECGACTVQIDGEAVQACQIEAGDAVGKKITTIEGLQDNHPVKDAWVEKEVPQCGYCHSGQIMSAAALLENNPKPSDSDIDQAMSINICRCGTYPRIRQAIHLAAKKKG